MLLQTLPLSCRGTWRVCLRFNPRRQHLCTNQLSKLQQPVAVQAGRAMREVLAAADATAAELEGLRLDAALMLLFPGRWNSLTGLKRVVRRGEVLVNGQAVKTDHTLQLGDRVEVTTRVGCAGTVLKSKREQLKQRLPGLEVAWQDDHMAVVIKPQGLMSQGPKGEASVAGRVKYCLQPTPLPGALGSPLISHRLDVGTGGLMLVAKTRAAAAKLSEDLKEHRMQKRYLAVVLGRLTGMGVIDHPVGGCPAMSLFRVEGHRQGSASFGCLTLVSLWPKTGRTHQLRKHMAYIGHPILGDLKYKHHRKPDCQVSAVDISTLLPQLSTDLPQVGRTQQQLSADPQDTQQLSAHMQDTKRQLSTDLQDAQQQLGMDLQDIPQQQLSTDLQDRQQQQHHAPVQMEAAGQQHSLGCMQENPAVCAEPLQQQPQHSMHGQQAQQLPVLEVVVPSMQLPTYDGGNPYHSLKLSAAGSQAGSEDPEEVSSSGSSNDSEAGQSDSCKLRGEVLQDGTVVGTCLWAVQLQLCHPATGQVIDISLGESPVQLFDRICAMDGAA